jgi:hypothetical protein
MTGLRWLFLHGTHVTVAGMENLKGLSSLEDVRVDGTSVTGKGAATLQRAIPKARITY